MVAGLPLRELLEPGLLPWAAAAVALACKAAEASLRTRQSDGDHSSVHQLEHISAPSHSQSAAPGLDSGMLDMTAFGIPSYEPPTEEEPSPQERPPAVGYESGQLDMSAFGLPSLEPAVEDARQPVAASGFESGMIDMSAFGLASPLTQPAQMLRPASHSFESGHLDMSSFGLPAPEPVPRDAPPQQQAASGFRSGTLDVSAFGLDSPPQVALPPHQTASDSFPSGQVDMSAFRLPAPEPTPSAAQQSASSGFDSGQIDMSAFGLPAPESPPPQAAQRSVIESGELDMTAFGTPASYSGMSEAPSRGPIAAISGNPSRNQPISFPSLISNPAVPPFRAEELAQLREQLGFERNQPLSQLQGTLNRPGSASALHTAASLFTSPSAGEESSDEESANGDKALPLPAPGLTMEETAAMLLLSELLLPDAGSQRCGPSRLPFDALPGGCDSCCSAREVFYCQPRSSICGFQGWCVVGACQWRILKS